MSSTRSTSRNLRTAWRDGLSRLSPVRRPAAAARSHEAWLVESPSRQAVRMIHSSR